MRWADRIGPTLLLATTNRNKIREIEAILRLPDVKLTGLEGYPDLEPPEETGRTFFENALLKARYYAYHTKQPCLAEDSGLEIDALRGEPGVHSARFMGTHTPYAERNQHLILLLSQTPEVDRTARYRSAVVLAWPGGPELASEGTVEGRIAHELRGTEGFGYDPIFLIPDREATFGELPADVKNTISHRSRALNRLVHLLNQSANPAPAH